MTATSIQTLATEARSFMVAKTRNAESKFWSRADDAPDWVADMCRAAHGNMLPDDHRYAFIVEALDALSDAEDADEVDLEADIYTHELTTWLASRADRSSYCDQYMEDFGTEFTNTIALLQGGQYMEKREVLDSVRSSLQSRAGELAEESDEDETTD